MQSNVKFLHQAVDAFRGWDLSYREILNDLPAAIYTTDAEGRITYFNKACVEFSGRTPSVGNDLWCVTWKLYTPDGAPLPHSECPMAVALREGKPIRGVEAIAERPNGTRIHFEPFPTPILDDQGNVVGAVNMLVDITEQKRTAERLELLAREVDHRANNLLGIVQGILQLTKINDLPAYKEAVLGRVAALARVSSIISKHRWADVDLSTLVREEAAAFDARKFVIRGQPLDIQPAAAQCFALLLHELCTNSAKYGALSTEPGQVCISWTVDDAGILMLEWEERGGPPVLQRPSKGTGSTVIAGAARQLGGEVHCEWKAEGLRCTFSCDRDAISYRHGETQDQV